MFTHISQIYQSSRKSGFIPHGVGPRQAEVTWPPIDLVKTT